MRNHRNSVLIAGIGAMALMASVPVRPVNEEELENPNQEKPDSDDRSEPHEVTPLSRQQRRYLERKGRLK